MIHRAYIFCFIVLLFYSNVLLSNSLSTLKETSAALHKIAMHGKAAVVSISTSQTIQPYGYSPFLNDPFFQHFYGTPQGPQTRDGLGSGVIVTSEGHILTNHHVVSEADTITVTLEDGREFLATRIGSDKKTDLAVLKINASDLPTIQLGDSDSLLVGQWAMAIGNPFGLAGTVTVGVISATGRSGVVDAENYADFIQTDAAINPGNSGGALLDIYGNLIGINTAIFSQSGGYMGIGFAIPINMAKRVMEDILAYGSVKRGVLGVTIQPITADLMQEKNLPTKEGAYVLRIEPDSSAELAGIKPGDIIIELGGKKVSDYLSLRTRISELKINESSFCIVIRNKKRKRLPFTLYAQRSTHTQSLFGLVLAELDPKTRHSLNLPSHVSGLLITDVVKGSLAHRYRLSPGQIITKVNQKPVDSIQTVTSLLSTKQSFLLTLYEQGYEFSVVIRQ